jgi:holo-[acyl-carrier protein] synthase
MIVGMGVGSVETRRFGAAQARFGGRLRARLFSPGERAYAARRGGGLESLAARFAAKLAARQALALRAASWHALEVVREPGGAPTLRLHGAAERAARERGVWGMALTLTHDAELCVAHVVLEGPP